MSAGHIEGFEAPLHRALVEPILLGGAPRAIAIVNGTLAAALGHTLMLFAAKRDPDFAPVLARHLRQKGELSC